MSKIHIQMFPASYGDSFLVQCGNINILIDVGFGYKKIKEYLLKMSKTRTEIDYLIFTHIDADHIAGGIKLLKENISNEDSKIIKIKNIWHNSYRHIRNLNKNGFEAGELTALQTEILESVKSRSIPKDETEELDKHEDISAQQGSTLAELIYKGNYQWNTHFHGQPVFFENSKNNKIIFNSEVKLTLLSPTFQNLVNLRKHWFNELYSLIGNFNENIDPEIFNEIYEFLIVHEDSLIAESPEEISDTSDLELLAKKEFIEDTSVTNASSISFILQYHNKKILFLGDAHSSVIENSLKQIFKESDFPLMFDAIKVSHHGSKRNMSQNLLNLIDSEKYLISTNGKKSGHPHPDVELLSRIVCRETSKIRKLIFNYPHDAYKFMNKEDLKEKYNFTVEVTNTIEI